MIPFDGLVVLWLFLLGLAVGSFLNAAEYRMRAGVSIARRGGAMARSQCTQCQVQLRSLDLIPVVSFVVLRGKCRSCTAPIAWQYPLVELVTAALFGLSGWLAPSLPHAIFFAASCAVLVFLFVYDLKYMLIPDVVTLPAIVAVLVAQWLLGVDMLTVVIGALAGGGFFAFQYVVSRGRWIGGGDIRLGLLAGAMLGWQSLCVALMLAYVGGSLIALALLASKRVTMKSQVPFGAFLVPAIVAALFFGEPIIRWYLSLFL